MAKPLPQPTTPDPAAPRAPYDTAPHGVPSATPHGSHPAHGPPAAMDTRYLLTLSLGALGVVYGDIGTSPLYALKECFNGPHGVAPTPTNVLGALRLAAIGFTKRDAIAFGVMNHTWLGDIGREIGERSDDAVRLDR